MAYMAIQNGLSVLLDGWSNSNLRAFFLLEIIVIAVFCVSGFILPNRRFTIGIQLMLAILGLVFFVIFLLLTLFLHYLPFYLA